MAEPTSLCCLLACFRWMSLNCNPCSEDDDEEGGALNISTQNSCRNWSCCAGCSCCNSEVTNIVGSSRVHVETRRKSTAPLTRKRVEKLVLEEGSEALSESACREQNKRTNRFVYNELFRLSNQDKEEVPMPRVAIIAAVRNLPDEKFSDWDENSEISLTEQDIKDMRVAVKAERARVKTVRTAMMQRHLKSAKEEEAGKTRLSIHSSNSSLEVSRRLNKRVLKVRVGEGKQGLQTFRVDVLARDILNLTKVTKQMALKHALAVKKHFLDEVKTPPTPQEIWDYLQEYIFLNDLPLKEETCDSYVDQSCLVDTSKKVRKVADLSLEEYFSLRDPKNTPNPSPTASLVSVGRDAVLATNEAERLSEHGHDEQPPPLREQTVFPLDLGEDADALRAKETVV